MSRIAAKTISMVVQKFVPTTHAMNPDLHVDAEKIEDRPLVFWWRRLTREERINLSGLIEADDVMDVEEKESRKIRNLGTLSRYIWDNCITKVENVLLDGEAIPLLEGAEKNRFFNTSGNDVEISEVIQLVQKESIFKESEVKN